MKRIRIQTLLKAAVALSMVIGVFSPINHVLGDNEQVLTDQDVGRWIIQVDIVNEGDASFQGFLKVYVVEPDSRWINADNEPYHFGFLDFAYNDEISVTDTIQKEISWNPGVIGDVQQDNLMVIAVLFNGTPYQRYAYGNENPFDAYFADATAAATPSSIGYNRVSEGFTHTVFAEEGTATWCGYCPTAAEALQDIYESGDYPFYYVALVGNRNEVARDRIKQDLNLAGYPTTYFDGGDYLEVGAGSGIERTYRDDILLCGQREVHPLNLSVSFEWDPDDTPPSVQITKPGPGLYYNNEKQRDMEKTIVLGVIDVLAEAEDDESEIDRVEFYVNGRMEEEDSSAPYKFSNWKENGFFGKYTVKAIAYDEAGNYNVDEIEVIRFF